MARIVGYGVLFGQKTRIAEIVIYSITLALKYMMNFIVSGSVRDISVGYII